MKKVLINGASGKMGTICSKTVEEHPSFELVAKLSKGDNLSQALSDLSVDIAIDLTSAESVYENTKTIIDHQVHPVIGTSGLSEGEIETLKAQSEESQLGGIIAPNFSIGAILMMKFAKEAAKYLPEAEIIEMHHQQKLDAPSGTAVKTAQMIQEARTSQKNNLSLKETFKGARGADCFDVNVHALRLPGFLASQQVIFGNQGETLTLSHQSIDRACFMPGVVHCLQKVTQLNSLVYGLEHLL